MPSPVSADTGTDPGCRRASRARSDPESRVDLVEHEDLGHVPRPDLAEHPSNRSDLFVRCGDAASATCNTSSASVTSSSVELNASTRSWGSLPTKPTVSVTVHRRPPGSFNRRTVGSSVANSWSATSTSAPVIRRIKVDFPAFV